MKEDERTFSSDSHEGDAAQAGARSLEVDWEALAIALENQLPDSHSFLDLENGRVVTFTGTVQPPEPPGPPERFLYIEPRPSREGYRSMQRFIETVEDEQLQRALSQALVGKGAFRRFKDLLLDHPDERKRWFAFKDKEVFGYAVKWLEKNGITPSNEPPAPSEERNAHPFGRLGNHSALAAGPDYRQAIAPFDRPSVVFRPERAALLVIDMQKIFVDPAGSAYIPSSSTASRNLLELMDLCRSSGVPIVFTRHVHRHPRLDAGSMGRWWRSLILDGSTDAEFAAGFEPLENEPVIEKQRYSAFYQTPLESMLRALGVQDVVIGGVMTNLCCETTARDAFVRDFNVFFLADATATSDEAMHRASLRNIAYGFGRVLSTAEAMQTIRASSRPRPSQ